MASSRAPRKDKTLLWIFLILLAAVIMYRILLPLRSARPAPAYPAMSAAHLAPAIMAPPKDSAVGKHVLAAIQANEKDVKKSSTTQQ